MLVERSLRENVESRRLKRWSPRAAVRASRGAARREFRPTPVGGPAKRVFDVVCAGAALVVLSPLLAIVALAIRIGDPGPVFFAHTRIGFDGRPFRCIKFRSMAVNNAAILEQHLAQDAEAAREWEDTRKLRDDPRVTRLGRFLRRNSVDELPQLINILRGEMSIVGPRPVTREELALYGRAARRYLTARPGLTGPWQISGRNEVSYRIRVLLDCHYVRQWTFTRDLLIITRTIPAVMRARGSY